VYPKVSGLSHNEIYAYKNKHSRVMAAKLTRLTHRIAIQLHLVAESYIICSSRSRWPVRKLLDNTLLSFFPGFKLQPQIRENKMDTDNNLGSTWKENVMAYFMEESRDSSVNIVTILWARRRGFYS
jgi:hypothetical protein